MWSADGSLDLAGLLSSDFKAISEKMPSRGWSGTGTRRRAQGRLVLHAYLQRVVNSREADWTVKYAVEPVEARRTC